MARQLEVGDRVNRKSAKNPVGIIRDVYGVLACEVYWGVADGKEFVEEVRQEDLELSDIPVHHNVFSDPE